MTVNLKYNRMQSLVLKNIFINKENIKALDNLTKNKSDDFFINVYGVIYKSILHLQKSGDLDLNKISEIAKKSKAGKKYIKAIDIAINDLRQARNVGTGFKALASRMIYFKRTHKGEIKEDLTTVEIKQKRGMATQRQVWFLEFIRRKLGLTEWNKLKTTLAIGGGTQLTKIEASQIIDYYEVNYAK